MMPHKSWIFPRKYTPAPPWLLCARAEVAWEWRARASAKKIKNLKKVYTSKFLCATIEKTGGFLALSCDKERTYEKELYE